VNPLSSQLDLGTAAPTRIGDLAALTCGAADAPAVLLVPGYTGTKEDFGPIMDAIAAAGLRAVAIDLPGQFESPGPDDPAEYSTTELGAVLCRVAVDLGAPVHLLGHSFGGLVSRAAVLASPVLFRSLVLMDSGPAALGGGRAELIAAMEPMLEPLGVAGVYDAVQQLYRAAPDYVEPPADLADLLRARFVGGSSAMLLGMGRALRSEPDRVDELRTLDLPTLVIYGESDDAWLPAEQDEMARRLGVDVVRIPDAVHSPAVENPAPTAAALIDFWHRVDSRATLTG